MTTRHPQSPAWTVPGSSTPGSRPGQPGRTLLEGALRWESWFSRWRDRRRGLPPLRPYEDMRAEFCVLQGKTWRHLA
jgi:hypothetical protein